MDTQLRQSMPDPETTGRSSDDGLVQRINEAFEKEERDGKRLAIRGRLVAAGAIAILVIAVIPYPGVFYFLGLAAIFVLTGLIDLWLLRRGSLRSWHTYAFAAVDFAVLGFALLYPNPFAMFDYSPQLGLRFISFVYFFVLLCGLAFCYRPVVVLFGGAIGALVWAAGILWIVDLPQSHTAWSPEQPREEILGVILDPNYVDVSLQLQRIAVFLIVAGLLALIVLRSRRLVVRQVRSERERSNLARYFPPTMVDRLAKMDAPLSQIREQEVAVLFADIVGFTRWSETHTPTEVIAFARQIHGRLEDAVFANGGTLDKFIGDGIMATFGTPETGPHDAANGLRCLHAILRSFDAWNRERAANGEEPVHISVALHYGRVVMGEIGSERCLEFAALGDTVNVTSRLERLTRDFGCRAIISEAAVAAVRNTDGDMANGLLDGFAAGTTAPVRGRLASIAVWTLG
ncbi:MAG: adenylate/guanylate cyclase domain-containing protein [Pseudomonadota bacterium]